MNTNTATRALRSNDTDVRVTWADDMRPVTHPHEFGVLFFVKGAVAWVTWDGTASPTPIARKALCVVK